MYQVNNLFNVQFLQNPHVYWKELRQQTSIAWSSQLNAWIVITYEAAIEALTHKNLATDIYGQYRPSPVPIPSSFELDTSQNRQLRRIVRSRLEHRTLPMKAITESCQTIKRFLLLETPFEFVTQFAEPLADLLVERWLGISSKRRDNLVALLKIAEFDSDFARKQVAGEMVIEELLAEIKQSREKAISNFLTELAIAWAECEANDMDLIAFISPLLFSLVQKIGTRLVTHAVLALVQWSNLQEEIHRGGYEVAFKVANEAARWEPITQVIPRIAKHKVSINGQSINQGDKVLIILTSVCRDSKFYFQPDCFNINRQEQSLAFGYGLHSCLGRELALTVAATAICQLLNSESNYFYFNLLSEPKYNVELGRACTSLNLSYTGLTQRHYI